MRRKISAKPNTTVSETLEKGMGFLDTIKKAVEDTINWIERHPGTTLFILGISLASLAIVGELIEYHKLASKLPPNTQASLTFGIGKQGIWGSISVRRF